jgi:hypothetical protein
MSSSYISIPKDVGESPWAGNPLGEDYSLLDVAPESTHRYLSLKGGDEYSGGCRPAFED